MYCSLLHCSLCMPSRCINLMNIIWYTIYKIAIIYSTHICTKLVCKIQKYPLIRHKPHLIFLEYHSIQNLYSIVIIYSKCVLRKIQQYPNTLTSPIWFSYRPIQNATGMLLSNLIFSPMTDCQMILISFNFKAQGTAWRKELHTQYA